MSACHNCEADGESCFDPKMNPALKREILAAKNNQVPDNYIQRIIHFAKQGYKNIEFETYNTDWDSEAYVTVSGQNSNNSIRVTGDFINAVISIKKLNKRMITARVYKGTFQRTVSIKISFRNIWIGM